MRTDETPITAGEAVKTHPGETEEQAAERIARLHELLDQMKDGPVTLSELARMSKEDREKHMKNNPPTPRDWRADLPVLKPDQVIKFAVSAAHEKTILLSDGIKILEALGSQNEPVELDPDAIKWLAGKFQDDVDDIMSEMDYASSALQGRIYDDAGERYRKVYEEQVGE